MGVIGLHSREADWMIAGVVLATAYLLLFPAYLLFVRLKHTRRIKNQTVTSFYNLPLSLTPAELAYMFSTRVGRPQLIATVNDLTNRGVLRQFKKEGVLRIDEGPKFEKELRPYEALLVEYVKSAPTALAIDRVVQGYTDYTEHFKASVRGGRSYVFWWLLREDLRRQKLIKKHMVTKYLKMLGVFGIIWSFLLSTFPIVTIRLLQMLNSGEVDVAQLYVSFNSAIMLWLIALPIILFFSFFLLRLRGRMLGRDWMMTDKLRRYVSQLEAYREFVRLTHRDKLRFESPELKKEARAKTLPHAIAFGYVKP